MFCPVCGNFLCEEHWPKPRISALEAKKAESQKRLMVFAEDVFRNRGFIDGFNFVCGIIGQYEAERLVIKLAEEEVIMFEKRELTVDEVTKILEKVNAGKASVKPDKKNDEEPLWLPGN